ncbi:NahK/ErcS family hybrid sensor histidine kinase/response regulator [Amphritea sp. 1_MG-2023]|uniref:PAS domain-containing hybrid sensor histidine kinase/response regulator n=1 Tax=Amphritea sp. 1_MG-2023 TaxID=3062670 RepID=UPI0026E35D56|nr:NahK/ErcS family hybrid sensor histidine kinase/response regulator [Amphritea sp. 1_MG-2023]MDO6562119.1 NahK/ErcS family hybrid sensor histidine kinase/response regulator [Amphritea sp. 1_MG-2023]
MKKRSEVHYSPSDRLTVERLMGLGGQSARKSHYPELVAKIEELEAERNRYKLIFDHAQHGIFQARLDNGLITANPALARICGYTDPQQLCRRVDAFATDLLFDADEYSPLLAKLQLCGKLFGYETRFKRQDGSAVAVSLNVLLKQDDRGDLLEVFVADITERRKAQNNLKRLNEELEQRVADRTRELVSLNQQLVSENAERKAIEQALKVARDAAEQANKSKDKYLAAASHDLLQPLNAARLLVSTLQERELQQDNNHLVERIHMALEGAEELLSDLLDISRLDQNAVQPDLISIPVNYLFRMLQVEFQPVAEQRQVLFRVCGNGLNVQSDTRLLMRVLRNFLSNAFRYTPRGRVLLGARRRADRLEIQVWDTGPGIPENRLDDIFREFQQIDHQYQTGRKGVGLGLAIVERIAGMLDHPVGVRSQLGRGTMFSVSVPLSGEVIEPILQPQQLPQHDLSGRTILVIDNEKDILVSMKALLEQWNCQVYVAIDAIEAIDYSLSEGVIPELILADFHLDHNTTGVAAVAQVREYVGMAIPAAIITADRSPEGRKLFRAHGLPVLNKPVKAGKLRALVSHLLQPGCRVGE